MGATIAYDDNATVTEALALSEDTEISVAAGKTVVYTNGAAISGAFKLTKKGAGTLKLAEANTFSGGLVIDEGFLFAQNAGALGDNAVTINGDGVKDCQLVFSCQDATFANDITITGSPGTKAALGFYGAGSTKSTPGTILNGNITAEGDFGIRDYLVGMDSTDSQNWLFGEINGTITASGHTVYCGFYGNIYLDGAITCDTLRVKDDCVLGCRGYVHLGSSDNSIRLIQHGYNRITCRAKNVLGGAIVQALYRKNSDIGRTTITAGDFDQRVAYLTMETYDDREANVASYNQKSSAGTSTLTIYGAKDYEAITKHKICGKSSLYIGDGTLNYNTFCQTFTNIQHATSGKLTVKCGELKLAGTTTFSNSTYCAVSTSAKITIASSEELALKSVATIALGNGEICIADGTPMPFSDWKANLTISTYGNGSLRIPAGETFRVKSAAIKNGAAIPAGRWTKDTCKFITLKGDGVLEVRGTALWSGAGTSEATSEIANWKDRSNPDLSIEGNSLCIPLDATKKTLSFVGVNYVNQLAATGGVVTLKAPDADARLVIGSGNIVLGENTTLVLNFKPEVADDTLVVSGVATSTVQLDGGVYQKMQLPNSKLTIGADVTLPEKIELIQVADEGSLSFDGPARTVVVKTLKYGETVKDDGDYTFDNVTVKVRGGHAPAEPSATATWDGGAGEDDTSLATSENWANDTTPTFDVNLKMIMASAGSTATVSDEVWAHSLIITNAAESGGPTAFTIKGATENAAENRLVLYGRGEVRQNVTPLVLEDLTIASLDIEGQGYPSAGGEKTFTVYAPEKDAAGEYPITMRNVIFEKPLYCVKNNESHRYFIVDSGVCEMKGIVGFAQKFATISVDEGATLILSGGVKSEYKANLYGRGTTIITNKPWTGSGGCVTVRNSKLVLAAEGNTFAGGTKATGAPSDQTGLRLTPASKGECVLADFQVDGALEYRNLIYCSVADNRSNCLELNGTKQRIANFYWRGTNTSTKPGDNWINGDAGSELWVSNNWTGATDVGANAGSNFFLIKGEVSFRKSGKDDFLMLRTTKMKDSEVRVDHTSTGTLRVDGGTLTLGEGVSWRNGPVEVASTTDAVFGTLKLSEDGQLGATQTLSISGTGNVEIPEGVTNFVYLAEVNGVLLSAGNYTGDGGPSDATKISQLTGTGVLSVRCADPVKTSYAASGEDEVTKPVVISNSWIVANVPPGKTVNDTAANGFKYWKCYVLGLTPNDPSSLPIIKGVQNAKPGKLAFALGNVNYNADSGVAVKYEVKESTSLDGTYTKKAETNAGEVAEFDLPADGNNLHYYRVWIEYSN